MDGWIVLRKKVQERDGGEGNDVFRGWGFKCYKLEGKCHKTRGKYEEIDGKHWKIGQKMNTYKVKCQLGPERA
jgi:hypothetical protein